MRSPTQRPTHLMLLHELAAQIQISAELPFGCCGYRPSQVSPAITARLQTLPPDLRHDYLSLHLRNYLYDIYYSGELQPLTVEATAAAPTLKNNTIRGVDADFYAQLHGANQGVGYFDPDWQVVQPCGDGAMAVKKQGLTVQIDPNRHLRPGLPVPQVGDWVSIHLPCNRVETGYYIAIGDAGWGDGEQTLLELCFNCSAEGAIAAMRALTTCLNADGIPFSFKVLMDPTHYQRYDAGVLQVERGNYEHVLPNLKQVYEQVRSHLQPQTPLFNKVLAPGLGLAEEPLHEEQDFGLHRCQIVADALLELYTPSNEPANTTSPLSLEARLAAIERGFLAEGLDLQRPYLNPNAEDIYRTLGSEP